MSGTYFTNQWDRWERSPRVPCDREMCHGQKQDHLLVDAGGLVMDSHAVDLI
jgi:hypothetical protein